MNSGLSVRQGLIKLKCGFESEVNCRRQLKNNLPQWLGWGTEAGVQSWLWRRQIRGRAGEAAGVPGSVCLSRSVQGPFGSRAQAQASGPATWAAAHGRRWVLTARTRPAHMPAHQEKSRAVSDDSRLLDMAYIAQVCNHRASELAQSPLSPAGSEQV